MRHILPLILVLTVTFPAAAVLVPGSEKAASPIAAAPTPGGDVPEAVATDGTDFLVVWSTSWGANLHGIFAAKVTESGAVSPMPALRLASGTTVTDPAVVWTGSSYLVLWDAPTTGGGLMAARLDRDANLIAAPFRITTDFNLYALAWDGRRAMALSSDTTGLKVLMLGPEGNIVRETRVPEVTITGEVGLVAAGGGFVAVWEKSQRVGSAAVQAMRFSRDGDPEGQPVTLPTPTSQGLNLDVDTDGERVGVAYTEDPNRSSGNLAGPRALRRYTLDARTLALVEHPVLQSTSFPEVVPTPGGFVAAIVAPRGDTSTLDAIPFESTSAWSNELQPAPSNGILTVSNGRSVLAVWSRGYIAGAVFDASLTQKKTPVVAVSTSIIAQTQPEVAPADDVALHTWVEDTATGGNLVTARVDRFGNPLDPPRLIAGGEWIWMDITTVFAGRAWLVAYRDRGSSGGPHTFIRRVGLDGTPTDEPPLDLGTVGPAMLASNRDVTLVVVPTWEGLRAWRFSADGVRLDATPIVVDSSGYSTGAITTNGREFLLVYFREKKLVGKRFGVSGNLIDASPTLIDDSPVEGVVSVASDGTDYSVAYLRPLVFSKTAVFVKRVLRTGVLAGATASDGGTRAGDGHDPRIAFLGTRAVVSFVSNAGAEPFRLQLAEVGGETVTIAQSTEQIDHALASRGTSLWLSYSRVLDGAYPIERVFVRAVDDTPPTRRRTARQ